MLISFVLAVPDCPLSAPKSYHGTVSYGGELLEGNYEINAMIGNNYAGVGEVIDGNYEIDIFPCFGITGTISFYINTIKAEEKGSYVGMDDWGKNENLNLTLLEMPPSENPPCGDGIKDPGEVCDGADFGTYTCSNYGFNVGYLTCSDSCDYIYTDNCYNSNNDDDGGNDNGGGGGGNNNPPSNTQNSEVIVLDDLEEEEEEIVETIIVNENQQSTGSGILGAVIGFVKTGKGLGLVFSLVVIVMVGIVLIVQKRK